MSPAREKVVVNGRFLGRHVSGVERFARGIIEALDARLGADDELRARLDVTIVAPPGTPAMPGLRHIATRHGGAHDGHRLQQSELPRLLDGALLLSLANTSPVAVRRQVVAIHDAAVWAVPEAWSFAFRAWYKLLLPALGQVARRVITVSEFSASELARWARIPRSKLRVVPNAAEHMLHVRAEPGVLRRLGLGGRPYVLAVGSRAPHKNMRVVEALERFGTPAYDVVHVGYSNPRVFGAVAGGARVIAAGAVSDTELRALYEHAGCFVFPSLYEGFGMPPLEAMACGCPVVASTAASIPEVCGDGALYFDPRDPAALAARIGEVLADPRLRDRLVAAGRARVAQFSWANSADKLLSVLDEILATPAAPHAGR